MSYGETGTEGRILEILTALKTGIKWDAEFCGREKNFLLIIAHYLALALASYKKHVIGFIQQPAARLCPHDAAFFKNSEGDPQLGHLH